MTTGPYRVTVWGARGSMPVAGPAFDRFGGRTPCVDFELPGGDRLLVDCGTAIRSVPGGAELDADGSPRTFHVLLTHYHHDHLQGLPFFRPLYDTETTMVFYGAQRNGVSLEEAIGGTIRPPWFPIDFLDSPAKKEFVPLDDRPVEIGGVTVTHAELRHPQGVSGYRLERGGHSVVIATDVERGDPECDQRFADLAAGCDVLIHDAQYTPDEYPHRYLGWGHSTWEHAVDAAGQVGAGRLVLTSHDPDRVDDAVDAIVAAARGRFPLVEAAYEGMTLEL